MLAVFTLPSYPSCICMCDDTTRDMQLIDEQIKSDTKALKAENKVRETANVILRKDKMKSELAEYLHAACYAPVKSTFIKVKQRINLKNLMIIKKLKAKKSRRPKIKTLN